MIKAGSFANSDEGRNSSTKTIFFIFICLSADFLTAGFDDLAPRLKVVIVAKQLFSLTRVNPNKGGCMKLESRKAGIVAVCFAIVMLISGCTTDPFTGEEKMSNTGKGAMVGAAGGALIGVISGSTQTGLIAAGIGTLAGGAVGMYMDRQEDKLREQLRGTGVSVTRIGDNIHLNMPGNITFEYDSASVNSTFYPVLNSVVLVLNEFEKTLIQVAGYTDNTGSAEYNQKLSERRAGSVGDYFIAQQIPPARVQTFGEGESNPVASNDTAEGRQQNRRVVLILVPHTDA